MTVTYNYAAEVEAIAKPLIAKHHTHLIDNGDVRIEYLFRSEAQETNGRTVWVKARKVSGLNAFLAAGRDEPLSATVSYGGRTATLPIEEWDEIEPFFVIEIAEPVWRTINAKQRVALVDHELSHCQIKFNKDGDPVLYVAPHSVEEFEGVVRRHGLYKTDVHHFAKVAADALADNQMSLLDDQSEKKSRQSKKPAE